MRQDWELASQDRTVRQHVRRQLLLLARVGSDGAAKSGGTGTRHKRWRDRLRESDPAAGWKLIDPHYPEILEALPFAVYATDAAGWITFYNQAAAALWGRHPILGRDRWCGSWHLYRLDGTPLAHDRCPMAVALRENREVRNVDAIAERPDGSRVHFMPYPTPLRGASEVLIGAVNILVDLSPFQRPDIPAV
jgi:PAS domain-containing protein